jgi:phosphate transport system substrate-binding protein
MNRLLLTLLIAANLILMGGCHGTADSAADSGTGDSSTAYIQNVGSDTMVNLALFWAERYQELFPQISISVTGGGSGTGLASLTNGTIDIANASRQIKESEIEQAEENGFTPFEIIVARDAIGVIVHPDNPINELSIEQISQIYQGEINNWHELGGEDRPIVRLSRETNSGTHVYFLETVIRMGSKEDSSIFSADTLLLPSSEVIIAEVRDNPNAIGYDGLGYITPEVKMIAISSAPGVPFVLPSVETVSDGSYPISRYLYMYTRGKPEGIILDYLEWLNSEDAQEIVSELGFVPISGAP